MEPDDGGHLIYEDWPKLSSYLLTANGAVSPDPAAVLEWYDPIERPAKAPKPDPAEFGPGPAPDVAAKVEEYTGPDWSLPTDEAYEWAQDDFEAWERSVPRLQQEFAEAREAARWHPPQYDSLMRLCTGDRAASPDDVLAWCNEHGLLGLNVEPWFTEGDWAKYEEMASQILAEGRLLADRAASLARVVDDDDSNSADWGAAMAQLSRGFLSGSTSLLSIYHVVALVDIVGGEVSIRTCQCGRVYAAEPSSRMRSCSTVHAERFKKRRQRQPKGGTPCE